MSRARSATARWLASSSTSDDFIVAHRAVASPSSAAAPAPRPPPVLPFDPLRLNGRSPRLAAPRRLLRGFAASASADGPSSSSSSSSEPPSTAAAAVPRQFSSLDSE